MIEVYTVFYNTVDYPKMYCVRKFHATAGHVVPMDMLGTADTLEEARKFIPEGLVPLSPHEEDEDTIIETWISGHE
jgi:hypothetical protein